MSNSDLTRLEIDRTLGEQLDVFSSHRYVIVLVCFTAIASGFYISRFLEPRFEAEVIFYVPSEATRTSNPDSELPSFPVPSGDRDGASAAVSILRTAEARRRVNAIVPSKPIGALANDVDAVVERSSLAVVFARDKDPAVAASVANAYFTVFNQFIGGIEEARAKEALARTQQRLLEVKTSIAEATASNRGALDSLRQNRDKLETTRQALERRLLQGHQPAILASAAVAPSNPVFPIPILNAIVAGVAGLIVGALYAAILDYCSRRRAIKRWNVIRRQEWYQRLFKESDVPGHPSLRPPASVDRIADPELTHER